MTMTLIATATVAGSAADIEFTGVPQTFTDLYVLLSVKGRTSGPGNGAIVVYTETGQSSSLSTWRALEGNGSGASAPSAAYPIVGTVKHQSSATFSSTSIYIPNYTSSSKKIFSSESVSEDNATGAYQDINALIIDYTSPISKLGFGDGSYGGGFAVGSTISLYGITRGSGGATVS